MIETTSTATELTLLFLPLLSPYDGSESVCALCEEDEARKRGRGKRRRSRRVTLRVWRKLQNAEDSSFFVRLTRFLLLFFSLSLYTFATRDSLTSHSDHALGRKGRREREGEGRGDGGRRNFPPRLHVLLSGSYSLSLSLSPSILFLHHFPVFARISLREGKRGGPW